MLDENSSLEDVRDALDKYGLPDRMAKPLYGYLAYGSPGGAFTAAILANDFVQAVRRADDRNRLHLREWGGFMYHEMAPHTWGDQKTVNDYGKRRREDVKHNSNGVTA